MNAALFRALALLPASLLLSGSIIMFFRGKTQVLFMQLVGAGCMVVVVITHMCEALHLVRGTFWRRAPPPGLGVVFEFPEERLCWPPGSHRMPTGGPSGSSE